ncbi:DUF6924 domain-containing protein [Actinoallomurus soli]|uniref:DUF6924 domain-containing protein n=1 Tax=Actinoallomurus soli TaxID=2952535 RepID=UPI002091FFF8|nr:hypothetical protein [Actinoallomurus soli]MCO5969271.1 hypothetical protein [Actinoallomurus soli]
MFAFRMWRRAGDSVEWLPASRLLVHISDGESVVPAHLHWGTEDGAQSAVGFSPDMVSCYGHRRTPAGDVVQVRGELDDRREYPEEVGGARGYEFETEVEEPGGRQPAGRLRVLIDDGGDTPVRWAAWRERSGLACSVALRSVSPSGNADVTDLVSVVWASAEHRDAGEVAENLTDASAGKWFAPHDRASLGFELSRPIAVDRYVLTSADDAPDRDPAAWTLRGSADGAVWRTLDVRSGESFTRRHQSRTYRIAEPGPYAHYRLDITGNNGSPHLQLQAVRLLADAGAGFVGYRQHEGHAPVAYRGVRVAQASESPPEDTPAPSNGSAPAPRARGDRPAEWRGWQPGGSWLPLGGSLSMESLTSPSGRFTVRHSVYEPSLAVRDNVTREWAWVGDSPESSQVCLGPDGDLVAWDHHGNRVWSTGTAWLGVRRLEMRDSGELALIDANGAVVWSSGIPQVSAAAGTGHRAVARGSRMRRGESLYGQSLTSDDGSTVLCHDGRVVFVIMRGRTSHWDRFPEQETVLALDDDGFLRLRTLGGAVVEQIAGPGAELVVVRGAAELRDDTGAVVWASADRWSRVAPVREPAIPQNDDLAAWFGALVGEGRGYCVAVVRESTPQDVLERTGVAPGSMTPTTWHRLQRDRDTAHPDEGKVVAAIAVGPDVLLVGDDPTLPVAALAPSTSVVALHQPSGGEGYGGTFSLHQNGRLVAEVRDEPRRRKGTKVPDVAAALDDLAHDLHRHELVFRVSGVVPSAAELGGPLLGGVLVPAPSPSATPAAEPAESFPAVEGYDGMSPLVVRTDFTDDDAWDRVVEQLRTPWMDDDPVTPYLIGDPRYADASTERVLKGVRAALPGPSRPGAIFIADSTTMRGTGHPLLAVSTEWDGEPFEEDEEEFVTQFRLLPNAAVEISTNLGLGNMDFEDFADDELYERMVD